MSRDKMKQDKIIFKKKYMETVSEQTLKIESVIKHLRPGDFISYQNIFELSGVRMDVKGRSYLRTALNRLGIEYTSVWGKGIELASHKNAISIVASRVVKIDNSVKRAEKTTKRITNQFYDKLNEDEQKNVNYLSAIFASLRAYSSSAKVFFKKSERKVIN